MGLRTSAPQLTNYRGLSDSILDGLHLTVYLVLLMISVIRVLWSIWRKSFEDKSFTKLLPSRPSLFASLPTIVVSLPLSRFLASALPSFRSASLAF